jgi:hypothetical protein
MKNTENIKENFRNAIHCKYLAAITSSSGVHDEGGDSLRNV